MSDHYIDFQMSENDVDLSDHYIDLQMSENYADLSDHYIDFQMSENYVNLSDVKLTSRWQLEVLIRYQYKTLSYWL